MNDLILEEFRDEVLKQFQMFNAENNISNDTICTAAIPKKITEIQ